jgi:hypothetical protein
LSTPSQYSPKTVSSPEVRHLSSHTYNNADKGWVNSRMGSTAT